MSIKPSTMPELPKTSNQKLDSNVHSGCWQPVRNPVTGEVLSVVDPDGNVFNLIKEKAANKETVNHEKENFKDKATLL